MLYVFRDTITGNLDVTWGYLWAAGFSAVPAVFLVNVVLNETSMSKKFATNLGYITELNTKSLECICLC